MFALEETRVVSMVMAGLDTCTEPLLQCERWGGSPPSLPTGSMPHPHPTFPHCSPTYMASAAPGMEQIRTNLTCRLLSTLQAAARVKGAR